MEKSTSNVILYIIDKLGGSVEGRKKLMKLMFLIEHWDPVKRELTREGTLKNEFLIYYYGVFSFEVMENFIRLVQEGKIEDGFPIKLKNKVEIKIDENLKERVDKVLEQFKNKSGYELEIETLKMLKIQPFEKGKYFGKSVREII
jgi:hypothetical protein